MERRRTMSIDASVLDCALCRKSVKPPVFKCDAGHFVCRGCCDGHIQFCFDDVSMSCIPCPDMDRVAGAAMVSCVNKDRGCTAEFPYNESADHLGSCNFVPPCQCPFRYCPFTASPAALPRHFDLQHFSEQHISVVRDYVYGQACKFPAPEAAMVAALVGKSDGCLFMVYTSRPDWITVTVSVVCLSASEDAPAVASQFRCQLWLEGGTGKTFTVASSDGSRLPDNTGLQLHVAPTITLLPANLMVGILKAGDEAGSSG